MRIDDTTEEHRRDIARPSHWIWRTRNRSVTLIIGLPFVLVIVSFLIAWTGFGVGALCPRWLSNSPNWKKTGPDGSWRIVAPCVGVGIAAEC